ncbi:hypothetical protein Agsp01_27090 [Agromyces sp. NBRC 114283]|nr:hypothetical protein Agsp01_27090 [Agromyces sp. NBRC 114283]
MLRAEADGARPAQAFAGGDDLARGDSLAVAVKGPGECHGAPFRVVGVPVIAGRAAGRGCGGTAGTVRCIGA